ncbi:hypothetical protein HW555_000180 [Spodoptera exigua]|uniref:Uncharacterized protein n=2 Tax=Spodoptera exigua TaxID=7107 RepID=A0A835GT92_SPOEX|nr:hypothetical protein HW555_000180 [Spodoptera exigua]
MTLYIIGFVIALVLAAFVIMWIAYCMFIRERHKSEFFHHNISDLQRKNYILDMEQNEDEVPSKKEMAVGVLVLPSRRKHKIEEYDKRPDYPESPPHISHHSTDKLIDILGDTADVHYKDGIYEVDSPRLCDTDV